MGKHKDTKNNEDIKLNKKENKIKNKIIRMRVYQPYKIKEKSLSILFKMAKKFNFDGWFLLRDKAVEVVVQGKSYHIMEFLKYWKNLLPNIKKELQTSYSFPTYDLPTLVKLESKEDVEEMRKQLSSLKTKHKEESRKKITIAKEETSRLSYGHFEKIKEFKMEKEPSSHKELISGFQKNLDIIAKHLKVDKKLLQKLSDKSRDASPEEVRKLLKTELEGIEDIDIDKFLFASSKKSLKLNIELIDQKVDKNDRKSKLSISKSDLFGILNSWNLDLDLSNIDETIELEDMMLATISELGYLLGVSKQFANQLKNSIILKKLLGFSNQYSIAIAKQINQFTDFSKITVSKLRELLILSTAAINPNEIPSDFSNSIKNVHLRKMAQVLRDYCSIVDKLDRISNLVKVKGEILIKHSWENDNRAIPIPDGATLTFLMKQNGEHQYLFDNQENPFLTFSDSQINKTKQYSFDNTKIFQVINDNYEVISPNISEKLKILDDNGKPAKEGHLIVSRVVLKGGKFSILVDQETLFSEFPRGKLLNDLEFSLQIQFQGEIDNIYVEIDNSYQIDISQVNMCGPLRIDSSLTYLAYCIPVLRIPLGIGIICDCNAFLIDMDTINPGSFEQWDENSFKLYGTMINPSLLFPDYQPGMTLTYQEERNLITSRLQELASGGQLLNEIRSQTKDLFAEVGQSTNLNSSNDYVKGFWSWFGFVSSNNSWPNLPTLNLTIEHDGTTYNNTYTFSSSLGDRPYNILGNSIDTLTLEDNAGQMGIFSHINEMRRHLKNTRVIVQNFVNAGRNEFIGDATRILSDNVEDNKYNPGGISLKIETSDTDFWGGHILRGSF